jgi:hypothetical protein
MPVDALPVSWPDDPKPVPGLVHYERSYLDVLQRPMSGDAKVVRESRVAHGDTVIANAPVTVAVHGGRLSMDVPPGTYSISAVLVTVDGVRVHDTDTVTLEPLTP